MPLSKRVARTQLVVGTLISAVLALLIPIAGSAADLVTEQRALLRAHVAHDEALARASRFEAQANNAQDISTQDRTRAAAMAARLQAAEANMAGAQARIAVIDTLRRRQRARLTEKQLPVIRLIAALELLARRPPLLALFQPGSVRDMVHLRAVFATQLPIIRARTAALRADVAKSAALRAQADLAFATLKQDQQELATRQLAMTKQAAASRTHADNLVASAQMEQDRALAMSEKSRDITALMSSIAVQATMRDTLAALPGPLLRPAQINASINSPLPDNQRTTPSINYKMPVIGEIVTGMGEETNPGVRARGLTIASQSAAIVIAPSGGHIVFAGPYRGFGKIVIIDHGHGLTSLLTNLAVLSVRVGDDVIQGSPIGHAGADMPITVELRRGATPVDITPLIS